MNSPFIDVGRLCKWTFLVVILLACGCKHDPDPNREQCGEATTIEEMMEWVYFKTGTYWIYEEQNSGALDTMTVYYDYSGVSNTGNREFVVKMRSSLDGYTYEYWFNESWSGDCSLFPGCFCRAVDCDKYMPGYYAGGNHVFPFPLRIGNQVGQWHGIESGQSRIVSYYEIVTIESISYSGVYVIWQTFSPQHSYDESEYQISKNKGIVRRKIPSLSEDWCLVESTIIQ